MKKILLLSVMGLTGASAFALNDITPGGYLFNNVADFNYHHLVYGTSNIASPVWSTIEGDTYYNDGLVVLAGNLAKGFGKNNSTPTELSESEGPSYVAEGTAIVNLGGEVGHVLAISGMKSNINDRIKELYGVEMNIPKMSENPGWYNMNFFIDPNWLTKDGSDDYYNVRARITCNFYENEITDGNVLASAFLVGNQGNLASNNTGTNITTDMFVKMNEDFEPIDDNGEVSDDYYWDPNKWIVYEVNMKVMPDDGDGTTYAPVRLKYDVKADPLMSGTMFIKSVEFFIPTQDEAVNTGVPQIETITLNAKPEAAGISNVAVDLTQAGVSINGRVATFTDPALVFNTMGAQVASVAANEGVSLLPGVYVATVNGKSVKFVIK